MPVVVHCPDWACHKVPEADTEKALGKPRCKVCNTLDREGSMSYHEGCCPWMHEVLKDYLLLYGAARTYATDSAPGFTFK